MQLKNYLPFFYDGLTEMDSITGAEQPEVDAFNAELWLSFKRQSVVNADEVGVRMYESILEIYADTKTEGLDFRKQRIISQLNSSPPFSMQYLRNALDRIIGRGKYDTWCDFDKFELHIQGWVTEKNWFVELNYLLARIKPANLLYIYTAYVPESIEMTQEVYVGQGFWAYKLGKWRLGQYPFYQDYTANSYNYKLGQWELGKEQFISNNLELIATGGIKDSLLTASATFALSLVDHVLINDTLVVDKENFEAMVARDNVLQILFVMPASEIKEIKNIKIVGAEGVAWSSVNMYVVVEEALKIKIDWKYREGVL